MSEEETSETNEEHAMKTPSELAQAIIERMKKPIHIMQINYKSGIKMQAAFHSFKWSGRPMSISYEWEEVQLTITDNLIKHHPDLVSMPIHFHADEVESVWQVETYLDCKDAGITQEEMYDDIIKFYKHKGLLIESEELPESV
jgi:hypothetical protein